MKIFEALARRKVAIKILTRVDLISQKKVSQLLGKNESLGWDAFQIKHCEHPLRAFLIDDKRAILKETLSPQQHKELSQVVYLYYQIKDYEWISWLQKVFWQLWNHSVDAEIRLQALQNIHH